MDKTTEQILRRRMHGLYLSRRCEDITQLSSELLGLHCWFHRNVAFSALIRGASLKGWKTALTKTWVHHALHGVVYEELPLLLAVHTNPGDNPYCWLGVNEELVRDAAEKVIVLMEDGVYSRAEMRQIFAGEPGYSKEAIDRLLSPWGGVFGVLAHLGKVSFRNMTSRNFDLISAEPTQTQDEVLPEILYRFFAAYGPATLDDAAWFLGFWRDRKRLTEVNVDKLSRLEYNKKTYYYVDDPTDMGDIPELTLLSGFDPFIVSYAERRAVLPLEYKSAVVMKSGICLPTIAVNGQVTGIWNIKKGEPVVEFFISQPKRIKDAAYDWVGEIRRRTVGII